jgi:hypothetical protein
LSTELNRRTDAPGAERDRVSPPNIAIFCRSRSRALTLATPEKSWLSPGPKWTASTMPPCTSMSFEPPGPSVGVTLTGPMSIGGSGGGGTPVSAESANRVRGLFMPA